MEFAADIIKKRQSVDPTAVFLFFNLRSYYTTKHAFFQVLYRRRDFIDEQLSSPAINQRFFAAYNEANPDSPIFAAPQVNYCLAVKKATAV